MPPWTHKILYLRRLLIEGWSGVSELMKWPFEYSLVHIIFAQILNELQRNIYV